MQACSILYKTRLPLLLVFNKVDVTKHDFAVTWMQARSCPRPPPLPPPPFFFVLPCTGLGEGQWHFSRREPSEPSKLCQAVMSRWDGAVLRPA